MARSRYDELCSKLSARRAHEQRTQETAEQVARTFCGAFAKSLGISDDPQDQRVTLRSLDVQHGEIVILDGASQVVLPNARHEWVFVVQVQLEDEKFDCWCVIYIRNGKVTEPPSNPATVALRVSRRRPEPFPVNPFSDPATYTQACDALFHDIEDWLESGPTPGSRKEIGVRISDANKVT